MSEQTPCNVAELASNRELMTFMRASLAKFSSLTFEDKADLVQDTLMKFQESAYLEKFDPAKGSFRTYLSVPLVNRAKTLLAQRSARANKVDSVISEQVQVGVGQAQVDQAEQTEQAKVVVKKIRASQKQAFSWVSYNEAGCVIQDRRGKVTHQTFEPPKHLIGKVFYRDAATYSELTLTHTSAQIANILRVSIGFVRSLRSEAQAIG